MTENDPRGSHGCRCSPKGGRFTGRNLVICIDGTSNRFSEDLKLTNVIHFYNLIEKREDQQLTFYNSGIGTYARPKRFSLQRIQQFLDHSWNQATAYNFEPIVLDAYRWLSDHYKDGDRIYLFGFSRGAYQVRVLSAMIDRVGLIHKGNTKQIDFAYELYAGLNDASQESETTELPDASKAPSSTPTTPEEKHEIADIPTLSKGKPDTKPDPNSEKKPDVVFKKAFCRDVNVHFVGAWDTVSSIGIFTHERRPDAASGMKHVCYFRHALALDERRVKFLPEYVHGGATATRQEAGDGSHPHTKEVWFSGSHSDVGGITSTGKFPPALMWMVMEAAHMGLRMHDFKFTHTPDQLVKRTESLRGLWRVAECMFIKRLSYRGTNDTVIWPHRGQGRNIMEGQMIHESVLDELKRGGYIPYARLPPGNERPKSWKNPDSLAPFLEPWGELGHVVRYKGASGHPTQRQILEDMRHSALTESGKRALLQAGVMHALDKLPVSDTGEIYLSDLHRIRDIFDEVYDGHIPKKLSYQEVQPALSHILRHGARRNYEFARTFLADFTDLAPTSKSILQMTDRGSRVVYAGFLFNNNMDCVIAASETGFIQVWNTKTEERVFSLKQENSIRSFACSPNGLYAVSTSFNDKIYVWSLADRNRNLHWEPSSPRGSLGPVTFDSFNNLVISSFEDGKLLTWVVSPDELKVRRAVNDQLDGSSEVRDIRKEQQILLDSIHVQLWGTNGQTLLSGLFPNSNTQDSDLSTQDVSCAAFSHRFAALGRGKAGGRSGKEKMIVSIYLLEESGRFTPYATLLGDKGSAGSVKTLAFSQDGGHLISGGSDNRIRIWDTKGWHENVVLEGHGGDVNTIAVARDHIRIASGSDDGTVRIWDARILLTGVDMDDHHPVDPSRCPSHKEPDDSLEAAAE